jgi:hypothetical protein
MRLKIIMNRYKPYFNEDINIPLSKGDHFKYGKFKNKSAIYDSHYINDKGDPIIVTDTGKEIPMCKIRLLTEELNNYKDLLNKTIFNYVKTQKNHEFLTGDCANFAEGLIRFISEWFDKPDIDYYFVTLYAEELNHTLIYFDGSYFDADGIGSKKEIESRLGINKAVWKKGDEGRYNPSGVHYSKIEKGLEIEYKKINKFSENLRISDLQKHAGTSDFTKDWVEIRRKIRGTGAKTVKLKSMKINRKKDYITFVFKSIPTYDSVVNAVDFPNTDQEKKVKMYTEQIMILDFFKLAQTKPGYSEKELNRKEIKEILTVADVKVSCDCKSFQFQGMNYILTTFDASIYPELRPPRVWGKWHHDDNFTCKHLDMLLTQGLNIYLNNMASMVNKYLKGNK